VAAKKIDPQIGWRGSWSQAGEAARALLSRRVPGKVILDVGVG
jgi:NADPH:quinone reductase